MPHHYDVFNGDADGICSLIQLRLQQPIQSELVTGVKRDIALLQQVNANFGDTLTVLDISLDKNVDDLKRCLDQGVSAFYADHHAHGEIPKSENLECHIHTDSAICTSLIISRLLNHRYANWAITGAFGDNMNAPAISLAKSKNLEGADMERLKHLGTLLNYNGYGETLEDLHFHPADLYHQLVLHDDPLAFLAEDTVMFHRLHEGYLSDQQNAQNIEPEYQSERVTMIRLPADKWARRISGVFGNELANQHPNRAHAIVTKSTEGCCVVSLRAPLNNPHHADEIAKQFPSGGGRRRAAGINRLQEADLPRLIKSLENTYSSR